MSEKSQTNYIAVTNEEKKMLLQPLEKKKQPKYIAFLIPLVAVPILIISLL
ncbi:hypothetical protein [Filobacillus milosensis]|uniref:hypothetical protein n=1 Tax=Filobacillus milosensis TaxID=94137 RepID=UPI00129A988C|nr:hypothetical protein [Filobacillus milosensis]